VPEAFEQAEEAHESALRILEAAFGPDHPEVGEAALLLAGTLIARKRHKAAKPHLHRAVQDRNAYRPVTARAWVVQRATPHTQPHGADDPRWGRAGGASPAIPD
jgi:thioredoxin-like negative regulator of GroEL